jgi:hypothetical protein
MYINHPTAKEEAERPERNLKDWVSTITESWYDNGKAMGKVAIHDAWLRERLHDPVARQHIGVSINTGGKLSIGKINGKDMQIVEKIVFSRQNGPVSVDWVTEAGARGRVSKLLRESNGKVKMEKEIKEVSFEELQRENPALVSRIQESVKITESPEFKAIKKENEEFKLKEAQAIQKGKISAWLKESKAPEVVKTRVEKSLEGKTFENEVKLKEAFEDNLKEELGYFNSLSPKGKIKIGAEEKSEASEPLKEAQAGLEHRMGIEPEKKEGEK